MCSPHLMQQGVQEDTLNLTVMLLLQPPGIVNRTSLISKGWTITTADPDQPVLVAEITVAGEGNADIINAEKGTLQLIANVLPDYASDKTIIWSIINGTGQATINSSGVVTAISDGTVTARATANDASGAYGELIISISNQAISEGIVILPILINNEIKIYLDDNYLSWKAQLFDLQGRMIYNTFVESDTLLFNISSFSPGIYIVVLSSGDKIRVGKIMIP